MKVQGLTGVVAVVVAALTACSSTAPVPDWVLEAQSASQRAVTATLQGQTRVADVEWKKAFTEVGRTAQPQAMAHMALLQCAAQAAALDWSDCPRYQRYATQATAADQAYARYLRNQHRAVDVPLLPVAQQAVARQLLQGEGLVTPALSTAQPLSQLIAAAVVLQAGRLSEQGVEQAVGIASAQGWRRAVMAWLLTAQKLAQQAGDTEKVQAVQQRLQVLEDGGNSLP